MTYSKEKEFLMKNPTRINSGALSSFRIFCTATVALCSLSAQAQSPVFDDPVIQPVLTNAPIRNVFVPVGFDDNDTVEVIVHGHFRDSCNKMGPAIGLVDADKLEITVGARALKYNANSCIPMEVPFLQSVKLGQLKAGTYSVNLSGGRTLPEQPKPLTVAAATTSTADDNLYAPVDAVEFLPASGQPGVYALTVSGIFPKSEAGCMRLKEVKILTFDGILVVLPISTFDTDVANCPQGNTPFERMFKVTKNVTLDLNRDTLIHVRVLNGQSVNKVIEFEN
jgi:hypothetical protein